MKLKQCIKPKKLQFGDTVGIIAPSLGIKPEQVEGPVQKLRSMGFEVKLSEHLFSESDGYAGSIQERADDFNAMVEDDSVNMILFGGGEVCNEILPYIHYESLMRHPKILCSYSDSTTVLNAVQSMSGLVTFYGASLRTFRGLTDYNWQSVEKRLMSTSTKYVKAEPWRTIYPGRCEGHLAGGYLVNYAALYGLKYYKELPFDDCILFIEDHEMFSSPAVVSKWFSTLEHRIGLERVRGLIFGHYSNKEEPLIDRILYRIGEKYRIPVVRCEDFGHGENCSILPIGIRARLDTATDRFELLESGVCE